MASLGTGVFDEQSSGSHHHAPDAREALGRRSSIGSFSTGRWSYRKDRVDGRLLSMFVFGWGQRGGIGRVGSRAPDMERTSSQKKGQVKWRKLLEDGHPTLKKDKVITQDGGTLRG